MSYLICEYCGTSGLFPGMPPHAPGTTCPILQAEHEKRMKLLDARIEAVYRRMASGS